MRRTGGRLALPVLLGLLLLPAAVFGHVGSPNVFFDGQAGPWPVRVIVRPPEVIPGVAEITVRVKQGTPDGVTVQPVHFRTGIQGAPPPETMTPVPGAPGTYSGQLWLMVQGSYSIRVQIQSAEDEPGGTGEALVPVTTAPTELKGMQPGLGLVLAGLGLFLFAGAVTLAGAAVRESVLAPGQAPDGKRRRTARWVMLGAGLLLALILTGGRRWWSAVEAEARESLYKPLPVTASIVGSQLDLQVQDDRSRNWTPLIPDHGKLMHLFLLREPGLDAFAHLHPVPVDGGHERFRSPLPSLPPGRYRLYADIVHESGFPQTLTTTVEIPAAPTAPAAPATPAGDPDDSWDVASPGAGSSGSSGDISPLAGGGEMAWLRDGATLAAGKDTDLRFQVKGADGQTAILEPYMGMMGHAVVTRDDGAVFVHLHPVGSFAMAAQEAFQKQMAVGKPMNHSGHAMHGPTPGLVSFPYEFPKPGRYRLWVQVKSGGAILTGSFAGEVAP